MEDKKSASNVTNTSSSRRYPLIIIEESNQQIRCIITSS
jgi:hypothetical protein